jgi:hypothetical protein
VLFEKPLQQDLAWRLLKLSGARCICRPPEIPRSQAGGRVAALQVSTIDPQKNLDVVERALGVMVKEGSYVKREGSRYRLDVEDDSKQNLDRLLARTVEELQGRGDALFETLIPCLAARSSIRFRSLAAAGIHERFGGTFTNARFRSISEADRPLAPVESLCRIGLPWGPAGGNGLLQDRSQVSLNRLPRFSSWPRCFT